MLPYHKDALLSFTKDQLANMYLGLQNEYGQLEQALSSKGAALKKAQEEREASEALYAELKYNMHAVEFGVDAMLHTVSSDPAVFAEILSLENSRPSTAKSRDWVTPVDNSRSSDHLINLRRQTKDDPLGNALLWVLLQLRGAHDR